MCEKKWEKFLVLYCLRLISWHFKHHFFFVMIKCVHYVFYILCVFFFCLHTRIIFMSSFHRMVRYTFLVLWTKRVTSTPRVATILLRFFAHSIFSLLRFFLSFSFACSRGIYKYKLPFPLHVECVKGTCKFTVNFISIQFSFKVKMCQNVKSILNFLNGDGRCIVANW